ncbi:MAG: hypothetical protein AAGA77_05525 [Bacteroidota bacterium]
MKHLTVLFFLFCFVNYGHSTVYTFHTEGSFTNEANWDVFPGFNLVTNDTLSIEANCTNIQLYAEAGHIVFSSDVNWIAISSLFIIDNCTMEIQANWVTFDVTGSFDYLINTPIVHPENIFLDVFNYGSGINGLDCPFDYSAFLSYQNLGSQAASFLECMSGTFTNNGSIEVDFPFLFLNCELDLADGTINAFNPFDLFAYGDLLKQYCSSCTATINNLQNLYLTGTTEIYGTVNLNGP